MKQQKLIQDYAKFSDSSLNFKAKTVVLSLTGNLNFPVMTPTIAEFTITQTNFSNALEKATSGDRQLIALKNQAKDDLLNAMRQLSMDVDAQANGDKALLISSGFDLGSSGDSTSVLGLPSDFKISDGINAGELKFSCKRAVNAVSYILEYTDELPTEETQWKIQPSSTRELTVRGLHSGIRIYGRMKAVGRKGQEANSDQSSRVVQ